MGEAGKEIARQEGTEAGRDRETDRQAGWADRQRQTGIQTNKDRERERDR